MCFHFLPLTSARPRHEHASAQQARVVANVEWDVDGQ
jgi:hypothetical protein